MSEKGIDKKLPAKAGSKSNRIDDKPTSRGAINTACDANEPSTSETPPPYKSGNSDVFVPKTCKDTHVGPQSIIKEAIYLEGLKRSDIVNINDTCKNCETEKREKSITGRLIKMKNNWTINKCYLSAISIILIETIFLIFSHHTYSKTNDAYPRFINPVTIAMMHNNLENLIVRRNIDTSTTDCAYRCPKLKSKVRFIILPRSIRNELIRSGASISEIFTTPRFIDIFYNYYMTEETKGIYEGRSLTCPHDDLFLKEDHSEMIVFGIPYCYPGRSEKKSKLSSLDQTDVISDFITNLKEKRMLTQDYILDIPEICEGSYLMERINRVPDANGRVTFYNHESYKNLNITTEIDPTIISNLLFLPNRNGNSEDDKISSSGVELQFPFSGNISQDDNNVPPKTVDQITIRFYFVHDYDVSEKLKPETCGSGETFVQECWPLIATSNYFGKENSALRTSIGNYYIFDGDPSPFTSKWTSSHAVYGQIPVNYSTENDIVINVFQMMFRNDIMYGLNEKTIILCAEALKSIREDVSKRVKYSRVVHAVFCGQHYPNRMNFVYQLLVDENLRYFRFTRSGRFKNVPCSFYGVEDD